MPTKKQRKRVQKERRHEYETVWVDADGNELEEPPEESSTPARDRRSDAKKPQSKSQQPRRSRPTRTPLPPSWRRATKRALLVAAALLVFIYLTNSKAKGGARVLGAVEIGVLYAVLFIPFMYYLDKFSYGRWQRKMGEQPRKR